MVEVAVVWLGAYLTRKASGLLHRAASDVDHAIDSKLDQLYGIVRTKLLGLGKRGERSLRALEEHPEDIRALNDATEDLGEALQVDSDGASQLLTVIGELTELDPAGVWLRGLAVADTVQSDGHNIGVDVQAQLRPGHAVEGAAKAGDVGGENIGVRYTPGQS